ncbi:lytic transglycosylase domain-containing protein [Candidatus Mycolicibacterium alkanivorans]|uniref:Lytic murein transglycosylase n=1 Tax=Candidatus Mycolicibacterium alkanivorans TaxID=2954114 RepID=A0ABS9YUR6_9MYCO|nr:lytic murein transglycosylase [Candidatus Mycolicibacterium alkanivorans]MCI4674925.1 lytic murein transglycosylase [Candidatus Mycolicibacterium alkanivorans]
MGRGNRVGRVVRSPVFGLAVLTPIVLAGAVGAAPSRLGAPVYDTDVTPLAAVSPSHTDSSGVTVVAPTKQPTNFRVAAATLSAPPPPIVLNSPGAMRIPAVALAAYRNAEQMMASAAPGCGVSWNLLAGVGRIESQHANGGATDARGTAVTPIYGPALDGTLPGNEVIVQTVTAGRPMYARAIGPMQFLPGTWSRYASDGDGDGKADPQNVYDAALAAARYLCSGGLNLRNQSHVLAAILRYNNSMAYAQNVMGWAAAYATGVAPVALPPIVGPAPAIGDAHLEHPEGLGPGMPFTAAGLLPGQAPCEVICMGSQVALPAATPAPDAVPAEAPQPWQPPWMLPAPAAEPAPAPETAAPLPATHGALPGPAN